MQRSDENILGCYESAISKLLDRDRWILDLLFNGDMSRLILDPSKILNKLNLFSSGQRVLIRLAMDYWDGLTKAGVLEAVHALDDGRFELFIASMRILRGSQKTKCQNHEDKT